jgi:hypothetical protein
MKVHIGPYTDSDEPRFESIEIHKYDSWNAFETIAKVVYPILVQLKATKKGYALVSAEDAPGIDLEPSEVESGYSEARWDYVLDEIIWTMKELAENELSAPSYDTMNSDLSNWQDVYKTYNARVQKGCELFGRYFRNLWD